MRDLNIKATLYFEAVARLGSVTKAAAELGVSPSAASQQIRTLEQQLGVRLFRREKRKLVLTLDGDRLFRTSTQAFGAIRNARAAIARKRAARGLTIRVSPSFGVRWLGPRISGFLADNPEWDIRVDATPDFTSFETEVVDLDLRYGLGGWTGLVERCVMHDLVLPLGSPAYVERLRALSDDPAEQLGRARMIDSAKTLFRWDLWLASNGVAIDELSYPLRFDRSSMSIELAKQGGGLALESAALCLEELKKGELVPLGTTFPVIDFAAYWFVCPTRNLDRRAVRRFGEWLGAESARHEAEARRVLAELGCGFRAETGSGLVQVAPRAPRSQ